MRKSRDARQKAEERIWRVLTGDETRMYSGQRLGINTIVRRGSDRRLN